MVSVFVDRRARRSQSNSSREKEGEDDYTMLPVNKSVPRTVVEHRLFMKRCETVLATIRPRTEQSSFYLQVGEVA